MKLIKLIHTRCMEYDCQTYTLAPDEWDDDEIQDRAYEAQGEYLAAIKRWKEEADPPDPDFQPYQKQKWYADHPDMTIREADARWEEKKDEHRAWEEERNKARRSFQSFLEDQGFTSIWRDDAAEEVSLDWGHRHGWPLDYYEGDPDTLTPAVRKAAGVPNH